MQLLVDGQLFQTGALERGMGTLTMELLRGAQRQDPTLDIVILLNDKMPMTPEHSRRLEVLLHDFKLEHVILETPATGPESRAQEQLEAFIAGRAPQAGQIAYLIPALFLFDYFALFPKNCKTILVFHDLIPLVMWEHLKRVFPGHVYFARFPRIFEADIILANSQNTRQELVRLLGVNDTRIVVMGGAPETIKMKRPEAFEHVRKLGIDKPYILLPTGGGYMDHKNNMRAAEAAYLLKRDTDHEFVVVATSRYEEHEREAMRRYLGENIIFTGNISTADMRALYCCADVVLAPALAEGLGIPLLNAVSLGVPVAASRIPVYTELSEGDDVFYEFDPYDVWEMRDALFGALARAGFTKKQAMYKRLKAQYTWDNCAKHLLTALQIKTDTWPKASRQLQVLMPDPLANGAEGYLAQSLYASAARHGYALHCYIDPSIKPPHYEDRGVDYIRYVTPTYDIDAFDPVAHTDWPTLVFLPRDANYARLHMLTRVVEGAVVYVSGTVSDRVYDAMSDRQFIDATTAEQEKEVQRMLSDQGLYNVPHPLLKARGILVERHAEQELRKLLKLLNVDCPVRVVPDNHNKDLNDYVHELEPVNNMILEFISEVCK